MGVLGRFFVVYSLICGSGIPFVGCDCMNVEVMDRCMHLNARSKSHQILLKVFNEQRYF